MESSIAVFLKRQLACELLPTCGLGHVGIGIAFAGSGVPWCHVAAILPAVRGQAPRIAPPLLAPFTPPSRGTPPPPPPHVPQQAHALRTISHSDTPPSELHQIRRHSPPTYSHTGWCNDHHHGFCVDQKCQQQAQEFTIEVILCKYSRRGIACNPTEERCYIARLWPRGRGGGRAGCGGRL